MALFVPAPIVSSLWRLVFGREDGLRCSVIRRPVGGFAVGIL